jgi:hypothetical protein
MTSIFSGAFAQAGVLAAKAEAATIPNAVLRETELAIGTHLNTGGYSTRP